MSRAGESKAAAAGIAQGERQAQGQIAAGAVAGEHDAVLRRIGTQGAVHGQRIERRGRERVLGSQAVVGREHAQALQREGCGQRPVGARRTADESAAVQVEQRRAGTSARRVGLYPLAGHAADGGRCVAHTLGSGQWPREGGAHRDDVAHVGQGRLDAPADHECSQAGLPTCTHLEGVTFNWGGVVGHSGGLRTVSGVLFHRPRSRWRMLTGGRNGTERLARCVALMRQQHHQAGKVRQRCRQAQH
jgi:hypothetical protein